MKTTLVKLIRPYFRGNWFSSYLLGSMLILVGCSGPPSDSEKESKGTVVAAKINTLVVDASAPVAEIQPTMYGIFFEDINFAADGGIYAEMVKNRSFEFMLPSMGWDQPASDRFSMNDNSGFAVPIKKSLTQPNQHFLRVTVKSENGYILSNSGYRGMGIKEGNTYHLTLQARVMEGSPKLTVELADSSNQVLGTTNVELSGGTWNTYETSIEATGTEMKGKLNLRFEGAGIVDLDMVSMFPSDTWKNRPKGLRADLVQLLADLDPGFLRFPGGCIVEGRTLDRRYQWKKTVGDIDERTTLVNRWNTEFNHRLTPDYYQSFGLGFFEYFQLSEDLGAEPLPILSCGIACQFNTGELVPMDELDPYVQDALDLIEFANGPVNSTWGQLRAEMGHPEPFNMKYIGIGNEQWGPEYIKRYKVFDQAIKSKYPEIIIVSGSGPYPDGEMFDYGMKELKAMNAEIVDEHYYRNPEWFLENADRYDDYDRDGPKIFAGEYAAQSVAIASPDNKNNWNCALSEAAFMTGLERNAEVVHLTSYAPLFAHAEGWQWTPDLIWFNNLEAYGTPNYYVQKLFSTNRGSHVLKLHDNGNPVIGSDKVYATAALDEAANEVIFKMVNVADSGVEVPLQIDGVGDLGTQATLSILTSGDLEGVNTFDQPGAISPRKESMPLTDTSFSVELEPYSLTVLRVPYNNLITKAQ